MSKAGSRSRKVSSKKRYHSKRKQAKRSNKRSRKSSKKTRRSKRKQRSHHRRRGTRRYTHMKGGVGSCPSGASSSSGDYGSQGGFTIIPSQLTDLGRSVQYGTIGAYNAVNGYDAPVNPLPFKDQLNGGNLPDDVMLRV
jgi:hypothetical protein